MEIEITDPAKGSICSTWSHCNGHGLASHSDSSEQPVRSRTLKLGATGKNAICSSLVLGLSKQCKPPSLSSSGRWDAPQMKPGMGMWVSSWRMTVDYRNKVVFPLHDTVRQNCSSQEITDTDYRIFLCYSGAC